MDLVEEIKKINRDNNLSNEEKIKLIQELRNKNMVQILSTKCDHYNKKCSNFYFAITSPTYFDENGNIKKIGLCELCVNEYKLDSFNKVNILVDADKKKYELKGLENGQYSENLNYN